MKNNKNVHEHTNCCKNQNSKNTCTCCENHNENHNKTLIIRLIVGGLFLIISLIFDSNIYFSATAYILFGYDVVIDAFKNIIKKRIFSEHMLMSIASLGAFVLGEYFEGCMVMLLYQIGELLCHSANEKSEKSIKELIDILPQNANLVDGDNLKKVLVSELNIDDIVVVKMGEKVPSDGVIIEGSTQLDTSKMTGEAELKSAKEGDFVIGGFINSGAVIKVKITTVYNDSSSFKILKLLEEIKNKKSKSEKFITVFSNYYTPIVVLLSIIIALLPPLVFRSDFSVWIYRALVLLVVSCPCALVISVPLAFYQATGCASKHSALIKGSLAIEKLSKIKTIAFDKTGTLTKGSFSLKAIRCLGVKAEVLELLAYSEFYSTHPLSSVLIEEYKKVFGLEIDPKRIKDYTEIAGFGIRVLIDDKEVLVGNDKLMNNNNIKVPKYSSDYTVTHIACDKKYLGYAEFCDGIKNEAKTSISQIKKLGITPVILSGDKKESVEAVCGLLDIKKYGYELLPQDKVKRMEELQNDGLVAFAGDGINDAPVICFSDVGIAMGIEGSTSTIEASDIVILSDNLESIVKSIKISKKTMKIVWQIIVLSVFIKALIMFFGILGYTNLWIAVLGDVGVSILCILNALRTSNYPED